MAYVEKGILASMQLPYGVDRDVLEKIISGYKKETKFVSGMRKALLIPEVDLLNRDVYKRILLDYFRRIKNLKPQIAVLAATTTWASLLIAQGVRITFESTIRGTDALLIQHIKYKFVFREENCKHIDTTDEQLIKKAAEVARLAMNRKRREPKFKRNQRP